MRLIYAIAALLSWLAAEPAAAQTDDPQQTVRILAHLKLIKSAGIKAPQEGGSPRKHARQALAILPQRR